MGDGMSKFYAVWRQTGGSSPNKRHETKDEALREADRLARQTNENYYVLEVIGIVKPVQLPVEFVEL